MNPLFPCDHWAATHSCIMHDTGRVTLCKIATLSDLQRLSSEMTRSIARFLCLLSTMTLRACDWQVRWRRTTVRRTRLSPVTRCRGPTKNAVFITRRRALPGHTRCPLKSGFLKIRDTPTPCHQCRLRCELSVMTDCRRSRCTEPNRLASISTKLPKCP